MAASQNPSSSSPSSTPPSTPSSPLSASLSTNLAHYTLRNPLSLRAYNDSCAHLPGGNTRTTLHSSPFPLTFASGSSCHLTSLDGDTYTDFLGEYGAGIYGHDHPAIHAAVTAALGRGWNFGGANRFEKQLARSVCERFAPTLETVRFTNSGTEANVVAVGAAMAYTRRTHVLVFRAAYHGCTISFPAPAPAPASTTPHQTQTSTPETLSMNLPHDFVLGTYNDVDATSAAISAALPPSTHLAAILVEPMLGAGGAIPGTRAFLRFLRATATAHSALLIFDEVMTSRLGYRGLGHELGIRPDMMTLGKWVGGGMSFGAFGGRREIMAMFDPRGWGEGGAAVLSHAGTFNNNVVSMAAGVAGLGVLTEEVLGRLNKLGERMKGLVEGVLRKHGVLTAAATADDEDQDKEPPVQTHSELAGATPTTTTTKEHGLTPSPPPSPSSPTRTLKQPKMSITGIGSIMNIHFAGPDKDVLQALFFHHMLEENIYMPQRGFIALSIEIRLRHVEAFVGALERFVERFRKGLVWGEGEGG